MDDLARAEFTALRTTIRTRGTVRVAIFAGGLAAWALVLVAVLVWVPAPLAATIPLLLLAATFESVRVLHLGIERIGRYLQVFYEEREGEARPPAWERMAMSFGPSVPGAGGHPMFLPLFMIATLVNGLAVVMPGPILVEAITLAMPHVAFIAWMLYCDRGMRRQRESDLARYRALKASPPPAAR
jgi:hypothetical protein